MKQSRALWKCASILVACACAGPRDSGETRADPADVRANPGLVHVESAENPLSKAIRAALPRAEGFVAVAAGIVESDEAACEVALLGHGRVKQITVDARTGSVGEIRERPVRPGSEAFAARIEERLPQIRIDLARAVDIALSQSPDSTALGVEILPEQDGLLYQVTLLAGPGGKRKLVMSIDPTTGAVGNVDEEADEAEHGSEGTGTGDGEPAMDEAGGSDAESVTILDFDDVPAGELPQGWRIDATGTAGTPATWAVVADATAPSGGRALALTGAGSGTTNAFNLCWTEDVRFQDGALEASMKPVSGKEDEGGGLMWRAASKDDYYVCWANPLKGLFGVDCVQGGRIHELASAALEIAPGVWHQMRVEQSGEHIVCSLDGKELLDVVDSTFADAGGVGFWTKSDAVTSFDDLRVSCANSNTDEEEGSEEMDEDGR